MYQENGKCLPNQKDAQKNELCKQPLVNNLPKYKVIVRQS